MYCYSNNGFTMRAWDNPEDIMSGEVFFDHAPTVEELNATFPLYNSGVPIKSIDDRAKDIKARYQQQLDDCANLILQSIAADGTNQTLKVASLQTKYLGIISQRNIEIDQLYEEEE